MQKRGAAEDVDTEIPGGKRLVVFGCVAVLCIVAMVIIGALLRVSVV